MKPFLMLAAVSILALSACAQNKDDKSKRPSPPATATGKTAGGTTITIDYSRPSVKGRKIGKDLEPMAGKVWRTGANEATTFEVNKSVKVEGRPLPAGKYSLFTIDNGNEWTIIFNKTAEQWGAFKYQQSDDALRVNVKAGKAPSFTEKFTITVSNKGKVDILWGDSDVAFTVE
jgi:hypothetical protein